MIDIFDLVLYLFAILGLKSVIIGQYWPWQWQSKVCEEAIALERDRRSRKQRGEEMRKR